MKPKHNNKVCKRKALYKDKELACRRAKELAEETGKPWRVYQCEAGRHYHLTTH